MARGVGVTGDSESEVGGSHPPAPEGLKNEYLRDTLRLPAATTQVPCTFLCGWWHPLALLTGGKAVWARPSRASGWAGWMRGKVYKSLYLMDTLRLPAVTTQVPCTFLGGWWHLLVVLTGGKAVWARPLRALVG